jgi:hypothetical protein
MVDAPGFSGTATQGARWLPLQLQKKYLEKMRGKKDMLASSAGSRPLLRWARGSLSEPYRLGTPHIKMATDKLSMDSSTRHSYP